MEFSNHQQQTHNKNTFIIGFFFKRFFFFHPNNTLYGVHYVRTTLNHDIALFLWSSYILCSDGVFNVCGGGGGGSKKKKQLLVMYLFYIFKQQKRNTHTKKIVLKCFAVCALIKEAKSIY